MKMKIHSTGDFCPPGFWCINTASAFMIIVTLAILTYILYNKIVREAAGEGFWGSCLNKRIHNYFGGAVQVPGYHPQYGGIEQHTNISSDMYVKPGYSYSNTPGDAFLNPYAPPKRSNPFLYPETCANPTPEQMMRIVQPKNCGDARGCLPVNVPTQGPRKQYTQVGVLMRENMTNGNERILPLFGRPVTGRSDRWQYYTMSDTNHAVKLPVRVNGRDAGDSNGVNEVHTGDDIDVRGFNDKFNVEIYNTQDLEYSPCL